MLTKLTVGNSLPSKMGASVSTTEVNKKSCEVGGRSTTTERVKKKLLKAFDEFKDQPNQLEDLAATLTDRERFKHKYFKHLIQKMDEALEVVKEERDSFPSGMPNEGTRERCVERLDSAISPLHQLKIKLVLYEAYADQLKSSIVQVVHDYFREFTFGPFHAAIHVDDILLEWGPSSLIIPKICELQPHEMKSEISTNPVLVSDLHLGQAPQDPLNEIKAVAGQESTEDALGKITNEVINLTVEKKSFIDELVDIILLYNTEKHYSVLTNNCHHFAIDILRALGITDHMEAFKGKVKEHASIILSRKRANRATLEFNSHEELDDYVRENLQTMEKDDSEFCYCNYLLFHAWGARYPSEKAWRCPEGTECLCNNLAKQL